MRNPFEDHRTLMRSRPNSVRSLVIILAFLLAFYGNLIFSDFVTISISSSLLKMVYFYAWWLVPIVLASGVLFGFRNLAENLGLGKGLLTGVFFSIVAVSPMMISSAILGDIDKNPDVTSLLQSTLFAGFMEELLFRGFLFGILFRKLNWGFIPAALLGSLFFGLGHIYQGSSIAETTGIFLITAVGAAWFAWLYTEWDNNLWVPVFMHVLMNLSWTLFEVSSTALGGGLTNVFRATTIALTIFITIYYHRKSGLRITGKNLIRQGLR